MRMYLAIMLIFAFAFRGEARARAQEEDYPQQTQTTPSYMVTLELGPASLMLVVQTESGSPIVQVMTPVDGASELIGATDQEQIVNHHLEIYLADRATGTAILDQTPTINILDQATGQEWPLANVVAMYDLDEGVSDWHYGNNLYLTDGLYTISTTVGGETATFTDVVASSQ